MATEVYGRDFWVGQIWHGKDPRECWRYVIIADLVSGKAKCHTLTLPFSGNKMTTRYSMISLKTLATRWRCVPEREMQKLREQQDAPDQNAEAQPDL